MIKDFKEFIQRGNVMELAVGFIMGTYFGAIVKSLVNDIVMPPIGLILGGVDFSELKWVLKKGQAAVMDGDAVISPEVAEVAIQYGSFINVVLTFLIVSVAAFAMIRSYNRYLRKKDKEPVPNPPQPTKEVELLTEIRDALKKEE